MVFTDQRHIFAFLYLSLTPWVMLKMYENYPLHLPKNNIRGQDLENAWYMGTSR